MSVEDQKTLILLLMRQRRLHLEEAAAQLTELTAGRPEVLRAAVESIRREAAVNKRFQTVSGTIKPEDEGWGAAWYAGPAEGDKFWPALKCRLEQSSLRQVVPDIDKASTEVVAQLASPHARGFKKRGLIVGYVQSGKTANYTAVMAKAADAGYKFFIVLSGLHNNLRYQTQVRVSQDLGVDGWHNWTTEELDFTGSQAGTAILAGAVPSLAVVKKNKDRLRALRDWLRDIPADIRERTPILLLDDEADQATPNTARLLSEKSGINKLLGEIWAEVKQGTYIGYTATPFANVFMDPNDEDELYPADFIISLPKPEDYFGAEKLFGREAVEDDDSAEAGLPVIRRVYDADVLRPPSNKEEREGFNPTLPRSLQEAVAWFVLATAIRAARGQGDEHSSMLVHTTHYVAPHFAIAERIDDLLRNMRSAVEAGDFHLFRSLFEREAELINDEATVPLPTWEEALSLIPETVDDIRIVVDNGQSEDRLTYDAVLADGTAKTEKVIVVGGGTLSRGLTLEGLVSSYFTRSSNTYDTLLQMGRWFGYRKGYEDLPRIWVQAELEEEYRFLATVEEEIRRDILHYEKMQVTPRQLGLRVRSHPGRLAIVARNKMGAAKQVQVSYSGRRVQTFIFDESNAPRVHGGIGTLDHNRERVREFVKVARTRSSVEKKDGKERWILRDIPVADVIRLLEGYIFHENQTMFQQDHMVGWLRQYASESKWNVVVIGSGAPRMNPDGSELVFPAVDVGLAEKVPPVNRAPLKLPGPETGIANINVLMSFNDWFADLDPESLSKLSKEERKQPRTVRKLLADGRGSLVIYPVSRKSVPMGASRKAHTRRPLEAPTDVIGLGIIFPDVEGKGTSSDGDYYAVTPFWEPDVIEEEED